MNRDWREVERILFHEQPAEIDGSLLGGILRVMYVQGEIPEVILSDDRIWSSLTVEEVERLLPLAKQFSELNRQAKEAQKAGDYDRCKRIARRALELFGSGKLPFSSFAHPPGDIYPPMPAD